MKLKDHQIPPPLYTQPQRKYNFVETKKNLYVSIGQVVIYVTNPEDTVFWASRQNSSFFGNRVE